ncbi:MAG: InlB B-repeat-containing protein [Turicibacter sp.]|nr:InlB B-repeat-containing protein [Turicibacter sp.]
MMKKFFKILLPLSLMMAVMIAMPFSVSANGLEEPTVDDIDFISTSEISEIEDNSQMESFSSDRPVVGDSRNTVVVARNVWFNPQGGTWPASSGMIAQGGTIWRSMNSSSTNYRQVMNTNNRDLLAGIGTTGPARLAPIREGFTFSGWYTAAVGGTRVNHTTTVAPGSGHIELHARWVPATVRITWNANGGSVNPGTQNRAPGTSIGTLPTPTRQGRHFIGWFTTANVTGGNRVAANTIVPNSNVTYHARWSDPSRHLSTWTPPTLPHTNITFRFTNGDATWLTAMRRGRNSWNNSNVPVTFNENSNSNNTASVVTSDGAYFGRIVFWYAGGGVVGPTMSQFVITMNSRTINNRVNYIESVFAHELGHAVGLIDNPPAAPGNGSLMNSARNRNIVVGPTHFDLESVNILYR